MGEPGASATGEPRDPDGNPDTSFLARIPADTAFTFQTLDKRGMVLHAAQTWHQLRPGEVRTDCGGCHAHSQKPTSFNLTAAQPVNWTNTNLISFNADATVSNGNDMSAPGLGVGGSSPSVATFSGSGTTLTLSGGISVKIERFCRTFCI